MSMKSRYLLHRNGRNQFGDPDDSQLPNYKPSSEEKDRDKKMRARHIELNKAFVSTHGDPWLALFSELSKENTWKKLYPHGRPVLSTFRKHVRECETFQEYLLFWLLSNKRKSLALLDLSMETIEKALSEFSECGRYGVTYGHCKKEFFSI